METEKLRTLIEERTFEEDGRRKLRCAEAFSLQAEHEVPLKEIGRVCNEAGIRICQCQLGCFK
jgi:hypothetical protein